MISQNKIASNEQVINTEIVDLLFATNHKAILITGAIAALLIYLQADVNTTATLASWASLISATYSIKGLAHFIYRRKTKLNISSEAWLIYFRKDHCHADC